MTVDTAQRTYQMYIDGAFVESRGDTQLGSVNPANGEEWYQIPDASAEDVDRAVKAARRALHDPRWAGLSPTARGKLLSRVADAAAEFGDRLAVLETRDNGKLIRDTRATYATVPLIWEYFAGWADKLHGQVVPTVDTTFNYLRREPVGVIAAIVPWNAPLTLASHKLAAALCMGNTVVLKPSEITSASILEFVEVLETAGLPPGVVNIVTGRGATAGDALVNHPGVDLITFTGGTEAGKAIAHRAAERHVRCLMELGGKSPNIVFADADVDNAANGLIAGIFAAAGQACTAGSRAYLHRDVYDAVLDKVVERAQRIKLGDPMSDQTEVGPVAYEAHMNRILDYVDLGTAEGASLRLGGTRRTDGDLGRGYFVEPTIFESVHQDMRIAREEIFGPVLSVIPFSTEDEVLGYANDTPFGLAAGVWTRDVSRAHRMAQRLEAGTVWINTYRALSPITPFGGFKASGHGKEGGMESLLEYSRLKSVWTNLSDAATADPFLVQR
jgi:acyl-CoA reductase-like NAD-dependent aldehyde dehydrogenase